MKKAAQFTKKTAKFLLEELAYIGTGLAIGASVVIWHQQTNLKDATDLMPPEFDQVVRQMKGGVFTGVHCARETVRITDTTPTIFLDPRVLKSGEGHSCTISRKSLPDVWDNTLALVESARAGEDLSPAAAGKYTLQKNFRSVSGKVCSLLVASETPPTKNGGFPPSSDWMSMSCIN